MTSLDRKIAAAIAGTLALGATVSSPVRAAEPGMEQCAGIVKAGKNDCATSTNACHSHVTTDSSPEAWIYVPNGTCERLAGAHLVKVKDPTPKK
jgi:uncharacterized membrane protein